MKTTMRLVRPVNHQVLAVAVAYAFGEKLLNEYVVEEIGHRGGSRIVERQVLPLGARMERVEREEVRRRGMS